jgi:HEPN domain-containing protein
LAVNRTDFQQLADVRIDEAGVLLAQGKYDGAYYLAGYAVECGLKACIAKLTNQYDFPDKVFAQQCFTHDIEALLFRAGLQPQLKADLAADPTLEKNWGIVSGWTESSRYTRNNRMDAQSLYDAITDPAHGALPWIKIRW